MKKEIKDDHATESKWEEARQRQAQALRQAEIEAERDKREGKAQPHVFIDHDKSPIGNHEHDKHDPNQAQIEHKAEKKNERF